MVDIDYTAWRFWFEAFQFCCTITIGIYVWFATRKKRVEKMIIDIKSEIDTRCENRLVRIAGLEKADQSIRLELTRLPTNDDLRDLSRRMEDTSNAMSKLTGRLEGINRAVDLMNEHLINQSNKG